MLEDMTIEQLVANRATIRAEWLERVAAFKERGMDATQANAVGPILGRDGSLWMFVSIDGARAYDLHVAPDGAVTER